MSITPSHIIQYLYCPRFTYFEYVLGIPQYEEKNYRAMRGRHLHDDKLEQNKEYLRKRIGVKHKHLDQYLTNALLRGRVDEVLLLATGDAAPLDYKFAEYKGKVYETYKTQLHCYAVLIEENLHVKVKKGYLVYTRSQHKLVEVPIRESDKTDIRHNAEAIYHIIDRNYFPKATRQKKRCAECTYRNVCVK